MHELEEGFIFIFIFMIVHVHIHDYQVHIYVYVHIYVCVYDSASMMFLYLEMSLTPSSQFQTRISQLTILYVLQLSPYTHWHGISNHITSHEIPSHEIPSHEIPSHRMISILENKYNRLPTTSTNATTYYHLTWAQNQHGTSWAIHKWVSLV